jgi:hypothetical protein
MKRIYQPNKETNKSLMRIIQTSLVFSLLCLLVNTSIAQSLFKANETKVEFFSEAPLENIEAVNTAAASMLNIDSKEIAVVVPIKSFEFEKDLMREHFNENYLESDKFKNASFKAKINEDINLKKAGTYEVTATGDFNIHGVTKERTLKGTMVVEKKKISLDAVFNVKLEDHDIDIPKIVFENIAEVVEVRCHFVYEPK